MASPDDNVMFLHCRECMEELPPGVSPDEYAKQITFVKNNVLHIHCSRHKEPIASFPLPHGSPLQNAKCECELCSKDKNNNEQLH